MCREFRLYDIYDGYADRILIGEFDTMKEAKSAALHWDIEETDGECCIVLYRFCYFDNMYCFVDDWSY